MTDQIAPVLGQIPSGLAILSARSAEGEETGMLASWIQQAAFNPPAVTVAVNKSRYLHNWLNTGTSVALSLVGETQKQLLGHFGKGFEPGAPAFNGLEIERSPAGLAVLVQSIGWLEGEITATIDAGDHTVFLLTLTAAGIGTAHQQERPWVHVRKNGLNY